MDAHIGDRIVIESHKVGGERKSGEVIDVIGGFGGQHYRVRWNDGHESVVYPSTDAFVQSPPRST